MLLGALGLSWSLQGTLGQTQVLSVLLYNLSNTLSLPPADVPECMLIQEGERVEVGQPLARTKGIFGLFKSEYKSRAAGTVEAISDVTGQLIIRGEPLPVQVRAFLAGEVTELIFAGEGSPNAFASVNPLMTYPVLIQRT